MNHLPIDFEDAQSGFLVGHAAKLADWRFRKEQEEFNRLVNVLRAKKWDLEHPERRRERANRYARKPEVVVRQTAATTARRRKQRHAERLAKGGEVFRCLECRAEWCPAPWARGLAGRGRFCSAACYERERYQRLTPGARRIRRRA